MNPDEIKAAAQKELIKRKARAELELRRAAQPPQPQEAPVTLGGSAKALGTGVAEGSIALPGGFGDVSKINSDILSGGAKYLGAPQIVQDAAGWAGKAMMGPLGMMPTTDQITKSVESVTGPMYKPQNTAEEYLRTVGQFAPAALGGPGGVGRKAAMALVPAVASETAGQLTEGEDIEPYARLAGGIGGGLAAAGRGGSAVKEMRKAAPNLETVGKQTDAAYKRLRDAGIQFDENSYKSLAMRVVDKLRKHGWRPRDGDPISGDVKEILGRVGKPNNWDEIENLRQFVGNLPKSASNKDFARAGIIKKELDDLVDSGKLISTKGIDPAIVGTMAKQARELGRKNILGKQINKMTDKSEWYLSGDESGLRSQVSSFGKREENGLTDAEKAAFKKVVRREGVNNLLTSVGGRLNLAVAPTIAASSALVPLGWLGSLATAGATVGGHLAARKISEVRTKNAIKKALETVLAGRPAQKAATKADKLTAEEIMVRRLIAGGSGQQSAFGH